MLVQIPGLLSPQALQQCRDVLADAQWTDGRVTAGTQSAQVKNNWQLPEQSPHCQALRPVIADALNQNPLFLSAALPKRIFPPLFNRYEGMHNTFGNHIDNAIRYCPVTGQRIRTDLSATVFLSDPDSYGGGELVIEDTYGQHAVKLAAGDMVLYPGSSLHRVEPVTSGVRMAAFFWIESLVRETERRRLLFEMDMAIVELRSTQGDCPPAINLTGCYHNLLRMWAEV
ncbi:MAG: Fe2+-dependent dioxygenase [Methylobacter sp.]|nr:MAG: Fe2+-dependent dioxygenase [Methylobacter sp.]